MKRFFDALPSLTITYAKADLVAVALIAAAVSVWAAVAGGSFSVAALLACEAAFLAFYFVGSLFAGWKSLATGVHFDLPLRLLVGYSVVNTALLVLVWLSPLGIVLDFAILFAIATGAFFLMGRRERTQGDSSGLWVIGLCLVATTLWCQDSIRPMSEEGTSVIVRPWIDCFYHSVHIRIFADSHGAATIEDFRMAG